MLEIILLVFLTRKIGELALRKGLSPFRWKLYTILAWIAFEGMGTLLGIMWFGFNPNDLLGLMMFAIAVAFGGYLFVRRILESKTDIDESM
jgi:Na+/H+-dicarboxylate symporter